MDNVEIRLLRSFLVLMSDKSVSDTAERLGVTQPAVSHALARLRTLFNDPLLLRSRTGMIPSSRASEIEDGVKEILAIYDGLLEKARPFDPSDSNRTFVITAPEYAERVLLPGVIRRARLQAPNMRFEVQTPDRHRAMELLESGRVDLRMGWLRQPMQSLRSMPLFQDNIVCIAAAKHPSLQGSIDLEQFLSLPHARSLGTGKTAVGQAIDDAVEQLGFKLSPAVLVQNVLTIPLMMAGSDLIATVPQRLAAFLKENYPIQILTPPIRLPRIRCAAYWHERSHKDPAHKWLRGLVLEAAKDLGDQAANA